MDFPHGLYSLLAEGKAPSPAKYRPGVYGRNFIPDLWQLRSNLQAIRDGTFERLGALGAWVWEFRRLLTGHEVHDLWVSDDRAPAIAELRQFVHERLVATSLAARRDGFTGRIEQNRKIIAAARSAGRPLNILFVCQGNICRSPYADLKFRQLLADDANLTIGSAGMLPRNPRPSPVEALAAARKRGVEMQAHRSCHAHAEVVGAATHIFIFDDKNLRSFTARYPELRDRVFYLGGLDDTTSDHEIHDPDGKAETEFDRTYLRIDRCLASLAQMLGTTHA